MTDYPFEMLDEAVAAEKAEAETLYAFPQAMSAGTVAVSQGGLTLRDYIAIQAMAGLLAGNAIYGGKTNNRAALAADAYATADAMIAAGKPRNRDGEVG